MTSDPIKSYVLKNNLIKFIYLFDFTVNADKLRTRKLVCVHRVYYLCNKEIQAMAQTNYYIGRTTNSAGESEINLRLYISRDVRLRIGSGIWIDRKRWGKKNDINPLVELK